MTDKLKLCFLSGFLLLSQILHAGNEQDFLASTGKIYVVVAVIVLLFLGIVFFLVYIERRISKMEKKLNKNES